MERKTILIYQDEPSDAVGRRARGDADDLQRGSDDLFRPGLRRAGPRIAARRDEPPPRIKVEKLNRKELKEATKDPKLVDWATSFRTRLIEPVARTRKPTAKGESPASVAKGLWGLDAIGASKSRMKGAGVSVAILDTGIHQDHPAFKHVPSWKVNDFSGDGIEDGNGHGTHCAGIVFGGEVDGHQIGVAPGIREAVIAKVLDNDGAGDSAMLTDGMLWAQSQGADIISMSIGFDYPGEVKELRASGLPTDIAASIALESYRHNLRLFDSVMGVIRNKAGVNQNRGCLIVCATGNESRLDENKAWRVNASLPAAAEGVLSVGAIQKKRSGFAMAPFSNSLARIVAPGVGVLSASHKGKGLVEMDGTSMACPHVAGAAALWWEKLGLNTREEDLRIELLGAALKNLLPASTPAEDFGRGVVMCP
jgi:subtilisin family serine protease